MRFRVSLGAASMAASKLFPKPLGRSCALIYIEIIGCRARPGVGELGRSVHSTWCWNKVTKFAHRARSSLIFLLTNVSGVKPDLDELAARRQPLRRCPIPGCGQFPAKPETVHLLPALRSRMNADDRDEQLALRRGVVGRSPHSQPALSPSRSLS